MIYIVCNNANQKNDGIGDYAFSLYKELVKYYTSNIKVRSSISGKSSVINKLLSFAMCKVLFGLSREVENGDIIIIEYPFAECNILIIPFLKILRNKIGKGRLLLSLHEYERVNFYRKFIIRKVLPLFDLCFVTDDYSNQLCCQYGKKTIIRTIPSNIYREDIEKLYIKDKDRNNYIFFGLLDKTKAIDELIIAWTKFNKKRDKKLIILSSSNFDNRFLDNGIEYHGNLDAEEISRYFRTAMFCILPIKPRVSENNATYKTALCFECIPIGVFSSDLSNDKYSIKLKDYSVDSIFKGLLNTEILTDGEIKKMQEIIHQNEKPSFGKTAMQYINVIESINNDVLNSKI